jgi:phospholipase C
MELTRRRLLGSSVGVIGGALGMSALPGNVRRALGAVPSRPPGLGDIKHVVFLMQENRSFDHYFGTMPGVRGFGDPAAMRLASGRSVFYQPDADNPDGYLLPFHLDTRSTSAQAIPSTSHAWSTQHAAWNNGAMDQWVPAHRAADGDANGPYTMSYYTRDDIPFQFALAEAFTICEAYYCSMMGPTWPNRLYWMTGTVDPAGRAGGPVISNVVSEPFGWTTYPERLQQAGVSWRVYQSEDSYGCNVLEYFAAYQNATSASPLYRNGLRVHPDDQFEYDAAHDRLPTISWIIPTAAQCEHPDFLPAAGADYVASKIDAIASNPDVWAKTLFVLNYDENDGLFDHVPPITPAAGTPEEFVDGMPIGSGFRVPCVLISPWTAGGWVCREPFDHTSCLRLIERLTGVYEPNISAWRRQTFGDLTSALRMTGGRAAFPRLPETKRRLAQAEYEVANLPAMTLPGADQTPPRQEGQPV